MRALGTVLGAMIALIALTLAVSSLAFYALEAGRVSAKIAQTMENRLVERVYLRDTIVSNNGSQICFKHEMPNIIRALIIIYNDRVRIVHNRCLPLAQLLAAKEIVIASRHGALLPIPDVKRLTSLRGQTTLDQLLGFEPSTWRFASNTIEVPLQEPSTIFQPQKLQLLDNISISVREGTYRGHSWYTYYISLSVRGGKDTKSIEVRVPEILANVSIVRPDNNILCYNLPSTFSGWTEKLITVCVANTSLSGTRVVIGGTLGYVDAPLIQELLYAASRYGKVKVVLGILGFNDTIYFFSDPLTLDYASIYPLFDEATLTLYAGPLVYRVPSSFLNPFKQLVAYYINSGVHKIVSDNLYLYYNNIFDALAPLLRDISGVEDDTSHYILPMSLYTPSLAGGSLAVEYWWTLVPVLVDVGDVGIFTYYNVRGASCRLVRLAKPIPPVYLNERLGIGFIPGLVCIERTARAKPVRVIDLQSHREWCKLKGYRVVLDCYYPFVLICNGTVRVYYNIAPSILYKMVGPGNRLVLTSFGLYSFEYVQKVGFETNAGYMKLSTYLGALGGLYGSLNYMLENFENQGSECTLTRLHYGMLNNIKYSRLILVCNNGDTIPLIAGHSSSSSSICSIVNRTGGCKPVGIEHVLTLPGVTISVAVVGISSRSPTTIRIPVYGGVAKILQEETRKLLASQLS